MGTTPNPKLWIVAGPNGSGKSTLYDTTLIDDFGRSVWIINPDLLTRRIIDSEGLELLDANRQAVERIMDWLDASLRTHQTVGVETVLSTDKYRALVQRARAGGFDVCLIYVMLRSPELNIERVKVRVARGGHDVPPEKIVARYERSLAQLPWFLEEADRAYIFDNSGAEPRLVAEKQPDGAVALDPDAPATLKRTLAAAG
ncbi:zeta toxin family protein [Blastomonas sp. SL216]|uniref:zeta toxin family protein n=1 Tax=Blastomonas sp. SL216 TaxID=2995169 RepID=UPI0023774EB0|nr:zeta toxin family protein [Blastomonas sp. SL216]